MAVTASKKLVLSCHYCGQRVMKWPSQVKGIVKCSKRCPKAKEIRKCFRCGEKFEVYLSEKKRTCSKKCPGFKESRLCEHCGCKFLWKKGGGSGRFCNDECRLKWFSTHFVQELSPSWRGGISKKYSGNRRSVYSKGDNIENVLVFERDDWMCHLCGEPIDRNLRFPHSWAATIDHIIPISKGGTHTWDNVAASHAFCNYHKGNKVDFGSRSR